MTTHLHLPAMKSLQAALFGVLVLGACSESEPSLVAAPAAEATAGPSVATSAEPTAVLIPDSVEPEPAAALTPTTEAISDAPAQGSGEQGPGAPSVAAEVQPTPTRAEIPEEVARSIVETNIGQVATALPDGKVLVTGGVGEGLVASDAAFLGDPATGRWEPVGPMHTSRVLHTATALSDGSVLIAGGVSDFESTAAAEVFNPDTETWTRVGDLAGPVGGHTAVLLSDGRVLVSGGRSGGAIRESGQQIYDPETESWTGAASLTEGRSGHTATLLEDGRVLIAGGFTEGRSSSSTPATLIEIYDPSTDLLAIGASMSTHRGFHTATLLPDGTVLASGGTGAVEIAKPAEVYDAQSDGWLPVGSMVFGTMLHRAVLLDDGRVLTFGGSRDGQELSLPEVYDPTSRTWSVAYQVRFTKAPSTEE